MIPGTRVDLGYGRRLFNITKHWETT